MAGGEAPRKQKTVDRFSRLWWLDWIFLVYTIWAVVVYTAIKPDPQPAIMAGVGLVGLAVIATHRARQGEG